jgi:hypothetical protein
LRVVGIILFALIMSLNSFVFGVIFLQMVPLLEAAGLAGATAVWVASLKGHGQFAGRLVEIFFGRNLKAMTIARISTVILMSPSAAAAGAAGRSSGTLSPTSVCTARMAATMLSSVTAEWRSSSTRCAAALSASGGNCAAQRAMLTTTSTGSGAISSRRRRIGPSRWSTTS